MKTTKIFLPVFVLLSLIISCHHSGDDTKKAENYYRKSMAVVHPVLDRIRLLNEDFPRRLQLRLGDSLGIREILAYDSTLTADKYDFYRALDSLRALRCCDDITFSSALQNRLIDLSTIIEREHKTLYLTLQMEVNRKNLTEMGNSYLSAVKRYGQIRQELYEAAAAFRQKYGLPEMDYTSEIQNDKESYAKAKAFFDSILKKIEFRKSPTG